MLSNSQKRTLKRMSEYLMRLKSNYPGVYSQLDEHFEETGTKTDIAKDAKELVEDKIPLGHLSQTQKSDLRELFPKIMSDVFTAEELADQELAHRIGPEEMIESMEHFSDRDEIERELGFDLDTGEPIDDDDRR